MEKVGEKFIDKSIDKILHLIYGKDIRKWLIPIVFFGFIFRLINVGNRLEYGDPAHFVVHAINFLDSGLLSIWGQSSFLWYAVTDIFYGIFGITQFASRFSSLLFGTATILVIYLFVEEFSGNKKLALITSILYAFAPIFIFNAADEHDISVLFFIILTFYCLIKGLNKNSKKYLLFSGALFGIACMWKFYVPILGIPYLGLIFYKSYRGEFNLKKNYKILIWVFVLMFIFCLPTFVYNYSNYKHNGVPTFFFVKFLGGEDSPIIKELYGWISGGELYNDTFSLSQIFGQALISLKISLWIYGKILWILVLIGILYMVFRSKKDKFAKEYLIFFATYFFIPYLFLVNSNFLPKHYIHFLAMALPIISYLFLETYNYLSKKIGEEKFVEKNLALLVIALLFFEFFVILSLPFGDNKENLFYPNPEGEFITYKQENIPENAFIIYDERIYNSLASWLFNDRYYISTTNLENFLGLNEKSNFKTETNVFIIECGVGACGWPSNEALDKFSENFFSSLNSNYVNKVASIKEKLSGKDYFNPLISGKPELKNYFNIYKTSMPIDLNLAKQFKMQYSSFLLPLGYENKNQALFKNFNYYPTDFFDILINKIAWGIFYLEILLSFLSLIFVVKELLDNN